MRKILFVHTLLAFCWSQEVLTLERCLKLSVTKNPRVLSSQQELLSSKSIKYQSFANFLPSASIQGSYVRLNEAPYMVLPTEISQFMPGGGKIEVGKAENSNLKLEIKEPISLAILHGFQLASIGVRQKELELKRIKLECARDAGIAYFQCVKANGFLKISRNAREQMLAHVNDLRIMVDQGIALKNNLLSAEVKLQEIELMVIQAEHNVILANESLKLLLGLPSDAQITVHDSLTFEPYNYSLDTLISLTLKNSIESQLLDLGTIASNKQIALATDNLLPGAILSWTYNYAKPNRRLENEWEKTWTALFGFQWNIFDWGANISEIRQAVAQKRQVEHTANYARNGLALQTKGLFLQIEQQQQKVDVARNQIKTASENFEITKKLFSAGAATNSELLDAHSSLIQSEVNYINNLADFNIAKLQIQYYSGELEEKIKSILESEAKNEE